MKLTLSIQPKPKDIEILIQGGALNGEACRWIQKFQKRAAVISDDRVGKLHAEPLSDKLGAPLFTFPAGEKSKTRETKATLEDKLLQAGFGRDTVIVAVGGGVVTDAAGFLSATYCRGVPLVLVPTSLLAMVDASIGGKTGVNMLQSKNFVGAVYQPECIVMDTEVLETQPLEFYRDGIVEMIKHGLVFDASHFDWIEKEADNILNKDPATLEKGISGSCRVKIEVVRQDEKEEGLRRILNFGHTIGHGIESVSNYRISHGTAVAAGCLVEGFLSGLPQSDLKRLLNLFKRINVPLHESLDVPETQLLSAIKMDKKALGSIARFVTLSSIGTADSHKGAFCTTHNGEDIKRALKWFQARF